MDVRVLGPVEARDSAGNGIAVAGLRPRALLAYLTLNMPNGASSGRILEDVWQNHPPSSHDNTLQVTVSRLRKAIGSERIVKTPDGYRLDLPRLGSDLDRFRFHAKRARQLQILGQHASACEAFRHALSECHGELLSDIRQIDFAERWAQLLQDERLTIVEGLMESSLAAGDHALVVSELGGLVEVFPYREKLWEHLMLALYRSGRHVEALQTRDRVRKILGESLGVESSPSLVDLEERILLHDPGLSAVDSTTPPAPAASECSLSFAAGAVIVSRGEADETVYWLESGRVRIISSDSDGAPRVIAELGAGRYFGELASFLGCRRTASVEAAEACTVTVYKTAGFRQRLKEELSKALGADGQRD